MIRKFIFNILVALDRFVNAITGGDPEMTISGRFGAAIMADRCILCKWVCAVLNKLEPNHCIRQALAESSEGSDEVIKL